MNPRIISTGARLAKAIAVKFPNDISHFSVKVDHDLKKHTAEFIRKIEEAHRAASKSTPLFH